MAKQPGTAKARRGPRGREGKPGIEPKEIHVIIEDIEKIRAEAAIQFKRIAQLQVQIDATLKSLKDMGDRAAKQRKRRKRR